MPSAESTIELSDEVILASNTLHILADMRTTPRVMPISVKSLATAVQVVPGAEFSRDKQRNKIRADVWLAICAIGAAIDESRFWALDDLFDLAIAKTRFWIAAV